MAFCYISIDTADVGVRDQLITAFSAGKKELSCSYDPDRGKGQIRNVGPDDRETVNVLISTIRKIGESSQLKIDFRWMLTEFDEEVANRVLDCDTITYGPAD